MKLIHIKSTALDGPNEVTIWSVASVDLDLGELQKKLLQEGIEQDPLDLDNLEKLMPLLKDHLNLSPFQVQKVELSSATHASLVVVVEMSITLKNELRHPEHLKEQYEQILIEAFQAQK
jgi:hypothetical protein